jgi:hypothetical protein
MQPITKHPNLLDLVKRKIKIETRRLSEREKKFSSKRNQQSVELR